MLLEVGHKYIKKMLEISTYDARKTKSLSKGQKQKSLS